LTLIISEVRKDPAIKQKVKDFYGESERGKLRKRISERIKVIFFFFKKNEKKN